MNTENKKKYLDKIKKLLRLAKGASNPHEAASAMAKVQAFMREYDLTDADVELSEIQQSAAASPNDAAKLPAWLMGLTQLVCRAFGVDGYFSSEWRSNGNKRRVVRFYGPGESACIASYAFEVLGRQLKQARQEYQKKHCRRCKRTTSIARADQFCEGWVSGAYHAVEPFTLTPEVKGQMEKYGELLTRKHNLRAQEPRHARKCRGDGDAAGEGYQQGKEAKLHHGVSGQGDAPARIGR